MTKKNWKKLIGIFFMLCICLVFTGTRAEAKKKTITINPKTIPCEKKYRVKPYYNKNTKQYYTLQSYLERLGKTGGTLKLKKGTYKIPCTLYVPSNVTIQCQSGVKLLKTSKTGTGKLKASKFMFQLVSEKQSKTKRKVAGYKASKNVVLKGSGTATIDLGKVNGATAVYAGHADNVTIQNIQFKNKKGGSYIWIEGSRNVKITKCKFMKGTSVSGLKNRMAIRLEVIHSDINGFTGKWSKLDSTVNKNITIEGNQFTSLDAGVGSTKYAAKADKNGTKVYYQTGIKITKNTFTDMVKNAVYAIAWKKPSITGNTMKQSKAGKKASCYVSGLGVYDPSISGNTFTGCSYAVKFDTAVNQGKGSKHPKVSSVVESSYINKLSNNTVSDASHYYAALGSVRMMYFRNKTDRNFTIRTDSKPYHEQYTDSADYSKKKNYYIFTSYMEQLEYAGGGTITVEAGNYPVTNNICIPSNVTLNLKDGVTFTKMGTTATDICYAKSIFTLVPPSKDGTQKTISGYNASHDVRIIGSGTARIDCANVLNSMALVMGHAKNITIRGITFQNQYGSHFMELNSSDNVVVENCSFVGSRPYQQKSHKECINVDGTDYITDGFNYDWSAHDKTTCRNIYIRNNTFTNVGTAVGSHTYSAEGTVQLYHENVQIYNNEINGTYNAAIRALNWKNCVIRKNTFKNIQSLDDGKDTKYVSVFLRGVINPVVTENTFDTCKYYPIRVTLVTEPTTDKAEKAGYPATHCSISEENWAQMQKNTVLNIAEKYHFILMRASEEQKDSESEKKAFAE